MDLWQLFPTISGYEWVDGRLRLYVDGPNPTTSFTRDRGVRTPLFRLYGEADAEAVEAWLAKNRAWQCLRVSPAFNRERAARGILIAGNWHGGTASAVHLLSRTRIIRDEVHRERLLREVRATIHSVLENPVSGNEFGELQLLEDVILVSPVMVELATTGELRDAVVQHERDECGLRRCHVGPVAKHRLCDPVSRHCFSPTVSALTPRSVPRSGRAISSVRRVSVFEFLGTSPIPRMYHFCDHRLSGRT